MFKDHEYKSTWRGYIAVILLLFIGLGAAYLFLQQSQINLFQPYVNQPKLEQENSKLAQEGQTIELPKQADSELVTAIVQKVGPGVVKITTKKEEIIYDFFHYQQRQELTGEGSGVILDQQGHIITNNHVVAGVDKIKVILANDRGEYQGYVVGRDPVTDLAVIKIKAENKTLPVPNLGDSNRLKVGEMAIAIGNPYGFSNTVTTGVISAVNRNLVIDSGIRLTDMIQTDAAINPGNSGGALLNSQGEVIGINTAIISDAQGLGFAIPINRVKEIAQQLIEEGQIVRPWLGIYGGTITAELAQKYSLKNPYGVVISKVIKGSPAWEAGLNKNDIIISLAGHKVTSMKKLKKMLKKYHVGDKIKVKVQRDKQLVEVHLVLEKRPSKVK